jgi:hypothetical protein
VRPCDFSNAARVERAAAGTWWHLDSVPTRVSVAAKGAQHGQRVVGITRTDGETRSCSDRAPKAGCMKESAWRDMGVHACVISVA